LPPSLTGLYDVFPSILDTSIPSGLNHLLAKSFGLPPFALYLFSAAARSPCVCAPSYSDLIFCFIVLLLAFDLLIDINSFLNLGLIDCEPATNNPACAILFPNISTLSSGAANATSAPTEPVHSVASVLPNHFVDFSNAGIYFGFNLVASAPNPAVEKSARNSSS